MEEKIPTEVKMAILVLSNYCKGRQNECKTCPLRNRNTDETCGLNDEEVSYWYDNIYRMKTF